MGNALDYPVIFDRLVLDACQVTNPSIDPLREPMELRTYLGKKPSRLEFRKNDEGDVELVTELAPNLKLETPIMIGHMSYGAISLNTQLSLAKAVTEMGTFMAQVKAECIRPASLSGPHDRAGGFRAVRR